MSLTVRHAGIGGKESVRGPGAEPLVGSGAKPLGFPILDTQSYVCLQNREG